MTDVTGAVVREYQGLAADPAVAGAGEARIYFNTVSAVLRLSVDGGPYVDFTPLAADALEYLPAPELKTDTATTETAPSAVYFGGSYVLPRDVEFNRVICRVVGATALDVARILLYQEAQGRSTSSAALIATADSVALPAGSSNQEIVVPLTTLKAGLFWAIWGIKSGSGFSMVAYDSMAAMSLLTMNMVVDTHPVAFETIVAFGAPSAAAPATLDPLESGEVDARAGPNQDSVPIIRLRKV